MTVEYLVNQLQLVPHPEGGYYKEVYRSPGIIPAQTLQDFDDERNLATSIYFLIEKDNFSAFHKIKSDETWHFYDGDALEVIELDENGNLIKTLVGNQLDNGQLFQYTVKANRWFGSRVCSGGSFSLVGCTVAPGFDFNDFEMGEREKLIKLFPQHSTIINAMTRTF